MCKIIVMGKQATVPLSTIIDADDKRAATAYCKRHGLKLRYLVERALIEQLEDEIDLEAYHQRQNEETYSLEEVLRGRD